jgi:hypothetical protein
LCVIESRLYTTVEKGHKPEQAILLTTFIHFSLIQSDLQQQLGLSALLKGNNIFFT